MKRGGARNTMGRGRTKGQWVALALVAFGFLGGACATFNDAAITLPEEGEREAEHEAERDGREGTPEASDPSATPVRLALGESFSCAWREGTPLANVRAIASGDDHVCAQLDDSTLRCWGRTTFEEAGQVGIAEAPQGAPFARPVFVQGGAMLSGVTRLALGPSHGCAECERGVFWCWGAGSPGERGAGAPGLYAAPMNTLSW